MNQWRRLHVGTCRITPHSPRGTCGADAAIDCLYGPPERSTITANLGTLEEVYVSIALHGHSPVLVSSIVAASRSSEFINAAQRQGARGIRLYGICCSGLSSLARYGEIYPLENAVGAELALGTGALDLWVADMQDVFPAIMDVAACQKTRVITTSDSAHLPGADHIGFDHEHSNLGQASVVTSKPAMRGRLKTGHALRPKTDFVLPCRSGLWQGRIRFAVTFYVLS